MAVTYKKPIKQLIDRDLKKQDLAEMAQISAAAISKMTAGDNVTMEVVEMVRRTLDVNVDDIPEFIGCSFVSRYNLEV